MKRKRRPSRPGDQPYVFINMPYAKRYENLYLAYISGAVAFGLVPITALSEPESDYQLERVVRLMRAARYSLHELSWMGLDDRSPRTPRFNMPFELGLAVAIAQIEGREHHWLVFDTMPQRLNKALSDLAGIRARIHAKTPASLFTALMNAFTRRQHRPTLEVLMAIYRDVRRRATELQRELGSSDLFANRPFVELVSSASQSAHKHMRIDKHHSRNAA